MNYLSALVVDFQFIQLIFIGCLGIQKYCSCIKRQYDIACRASCKIL